MTVIFWYIVGGPETTLAMLPMFEVYVWLLGMLERVEYISSMLIQQVQPRHLPTFGNLFQLSERLKIHCLRALQMNLSPQTNNLAYR